MGCSSSKPAEIPLEPVSARAAAGNAALSVTSTPLTPRTEASSAAPQPLARAHSTKSTHSSKVPHTRNKLDSAPQRVRSTKHSSPQEHRRPAKSLAVPSASSRPRHGLSTPALSRTGIRALAPTIHQVLSSCPKFRILVVGKKRSGKSSLINTIFKVETSGALGHINQDIHCDDNRYLIFHECSAFGPGDENWQRIRDFISNRTNPECPTNERLHAVWICVPAADAMSGNIGEGVKEILDMNRVPVVVALTKFDRAITSGGGDPARTHARTQIERSCRPLFHKGLADVPAEIVSVKPGFSDLIDSLVATTNKLITPSRAASTPPERRRAQGTKSRIAPVPLVWAAALRVNQGIFIQASIEVGRSRYWRSLWTSLDFADENLKECVNVIHTDIVEIWNLNDRTRYLSGSEFKQKMSRVVGDMVESMPSRFDFAEWVHDVYRGSQENVLCVMCYIVDLTVILDGIFRIAAHYVSVNDIQMVMDMHVNSGRRDRIHGDIRNFVAETFESRFMGTERDLVLEMIIDLIRQYCVPPPRDFR